MKNAMKFTKLGDSDLTVSRICMGCMGFGDAGLCEARRCCSCDKISFPDTGGHRGRRYRAAAY